MNIRNGQAVLAEALMNAKFCVLWSGEREFIFGDGFLHNVHDLNNPPWKPHGIVPITPEIAIFIRRHGSGRIYPKAFAMSLTEAEVDMVNDSVQVYSRDFLFFREIYPTISDHFSEQTHYQYEYDRTQWIISISEAMANAYFGGDKEFYPDGRPLPLRMKREPLISRRR